MAIILARGFMGCMVQSNDPVRELTDMFNRRIAIHNVIALIALGSLVAAKEGEAARRKNQKK